mgnify:CR=1 FL=1
MTENFSDRLAELRRDRRLSGRAFAKAAGLKPSTYQALTTGRSPTLDTLVTISQSLGVDIRWLATGEGMRGRNQDITHPDFSGIPVSFSLSDHVAMVTRLSIEVSAGHAAIVAHDDPLDFVAFPEPWLRRRGINPRTARVLTVRGDSMEPTIRSGDVLLVDVSWSAIRDNGIYVIVTKSYVAVKRIHAKVDGSLRIVSDNPAYPPEDVPETSKNDITVAGRVMWYGRLL